MKSEYDFSKAKRAKDVEHLARLRKQAIRLKQVDGLPAKAKQTRQNEITESLAPRDD